VDEAGAKAEAAATKTARRRRESFAIFKSNMKQSLKKFKINKRINGAKIKASHVSSCHHYELKSTRPSP
jgi:hypothetical protein